MPKIAFEPCLPTRGTRVPAGPEWLHEIKHDGYRLIVHRDGARVRLFTRNGPDWTGRYPLIVEAALKNRQTSFVIDGEAVLLGVDGISDFNGLHSRKHDDEVQLYAFDILRSMERICGSCRCTFAKPTWRDYWRGGRRAFSSATLSKARSGRTYSARPATSVWRAWFRSAAIVHTAPAGLRTGSR